MTPATEQDAITREPLKLQPLCPSSSSTNKHNLSLKTLITVRFAKSPNQSTQSSGATTYVCPACDKTHSNSLRAVVAVPCGHVLCKPCARRFMSPDTDPPDPHASPGEQQSGKLVCYVCSMDLTEFKKSKKSGKSSEKSIIKPGTIELKSEGTGFAGGGDNMVTAKGTAFQC